MKADETMKLGYYAMFDETLTPEEREFAAFLYNAGNHSKLPISFDKIPSCVK